MNRRGFLRLAAGSIWLAAGGVLAGESRETTIRAGGPAPSRERPLVLDEERKRVLIYTEPNGKSFEKKNPHWGVVFKDGSLADKGILKAFCAPAAFHDALVQIGARPGNDLTEESVGRSSKGDGLSVTALLPGAGHELPLDRVFRDSSGKGFSIRFGGNRSAAEEANTGCIMCLESCWVGITSNAAYPVISGVTRFFSPNSLFSGDGSLFSSSGRPSLVLAYKVA